MKLCRIVSEVDFQRHCAHRNYRIDGDSFATHADRRITGSFGGLTPVGQLALGRGDVLLLGELGQ
jgi:hypothetical protein